MEKLTGLTTLRFPQSPFSSILKTNTMKTIANLKPILFTSLIFHQKNDHF